MWFAFFINFKLLSIKPDTENNANFENYASHMPAVHMAPFSKEDKNFDQKYAWMQKLQRSAVYSRVFRLRLDEKQHQQAAGEVE